MRFNRNSRDITIECWPRWEDPSREGARQYPGWPVKINQMDNYNRKAVAWLPTLQITGITNPVVQVINEENDKVVYTVRLAKVSFQPKVFNQGIYTINIGEQGTAQWQSFSGIKSELEDTHSILDVKF